MVAPVSGVFGNNFLFREGKGVWAEVQATSIILSSQSHNISEHYLIERGGQNIRGDIFGLQTSVNTFFGCQRFKSKNFVHIRVQKYMIYFFSEIKILNVQSCRLKSITIYFLSNCANAKIRLGEIDHLPG